MKNTEGNLWEAEIDGLPVSSSSDERREESNCLLVGSNVWCNAVRANVEERGLGEIVLRDGIREMMKKLVDHDGPDWCWRCRWVNTSSSLL